MPKIALRECLKKPKIALIEWYFCTTYYITLTLLYATELVLCYFGNILPHKRIYDPIIGCLIHNLDKAASVIHVPISPLLIQILDIIFQTIPKSHYISSSFWMPGSNFTTVKIFPLLVSPMPRAWMILEEKSMTTYRAPFTWPLLWSKLVKSMMGLPLFNTIRWSGIPDKVTCKRKVNINYSNSVVNR